MSDNDKTSIKSVELERRDTIQARATQEAQGRLPILLMMAHAGEIIAPWWSKRRDFDLDRFWKGSDHCSGAFYTLASKLSSVPFRIEPRDASVKAWRKLAEEYQYRLEAESEFGQGWGVLAAKWLIDLYTQDNGAFFEVIGGGRKDQQIKGLPVGIAHLDSQRCTRTGSVDYPVIYEDMDGKTYMLHRSRVLYRAQLPSARADMYDIGFCWLSRCLNVAQTMVDVLVYKQEKLGSRPKRAIGITKGGLDPDAVIEALSMADSMMDAQGLRRYSKIPFIGDEGIPDADLSLIDMASLPDGFDYEQDITLGMFTIALAGAVPPRWLWPATTTGATKADAMYQHVAGLTGGPGATLQMIATMLGGPEKGEYQPTDVPRFLPPQLRIVFDFQDDEQDRTSAEIAQVRAATREKDINTGIITPRIAREQMLKAGEITEDEFEEIELDEGRLPDGSDVLTLFYSRDNQMIGLLAIDAEGEPLEVEDNDPALWVEAIDKQIRLAEDIAVNGVNASIRRKARQAIVAMQKLRDLYEAPEEQPETKPMEDDSPNVVDEEAVEETPPPEEKEPPPPDEEEEEVKEDASPFEQKSGLDDFRLAVRAAVRGYWSGELERFDFVDSMRATIERRLRQAWYEGAATCGISPADLTAEEISAMTDKINSQFPHMINFTDAIEDGSKANGGLLQPLLDRAELWIAQYPSTVELAKQMACGDEKLGWLVDPRKENCGSCLKLNGKVKRASFWRKTGVVPRNGPNNMLECGGWNCGCTLSPTDAPVSRGPLPRLP